MATPDGGTKAIIAALLANVGIAITKLIAFLLTGSSSMLAETIHSTADSGNQMLLLFGGRRARRTATPQHPFGFGRERYFYGFVVAVVLFSVGGLFALYEAWQKFSDPHGFTSWQWVPIVVLLVAITLELFSLRTAVREARNAKGDQGWVQFIRRTRQPELPVVLLEDIGALVGLVFALVGVTLTLVTGDGRWDATGTAAIGVLLVAIAAFLAIETKSMLIGEAATEENLAALVAAIPGGGVEQLIHMKTLHLGPEELLVAAKIAVPGRLTGAQIAAAIDGAEARMRQAVPLKLVIYLEPDLYLDSNLNG